MLRSISQALLLILLTVSGFQCKKHKDESPTLVGKLIASDGCAQYVVEVVDGPVDPAMVIATWTDTDNDSVYHNVFRLTGVQDACGIGYYGVSKGDTFTFRMDPDPQHTLCYVCALMTTLAMPPVSDAIKDITKIQGAYPTNGH